LRQVLRTWKKHRDIKRRGVDFSDRKKGFVGRGKKGGGRLGLGRNGSILSTSLLVNLPGIGIRVCQAWGGGATWKWISDLGQTLGFSAIRSTPTIFGKIALWEESGFCIFANRHFFKDGQDEGRRLLIFPWPPRDTNVADGAKLVVFSRRPLQYYGKRAGGNS